MGMTDPNPLVNGKGSRKLRNAGIKVIPGVLRKECAAPNEWFFKRFHSSLPYVTVKAAISLDGKIATATGESQWISSPVSRGYAHLLRLRHDAIMAGTSTISIDNPSLTLRGHGNAKQPHKIVLDRTGRLPRSLKVFQSIAGESVFYFTTIRKPRFINHPFIRSFRVAERKGRMDLKEILLILREHEIFSILVEGGGELNASLFENGWADRICAVIAPKLIGGRTAPTLFDGRGFSRLKDAPVLSDVEHIASGTDLIMQGYLRRYS
jgi:diaminohydroxyphosphoribosylaminopyrimidine deaminase/5-amino-6-(5-phosphoribosylamino)uracil reductase